MAERKLNFTRRALIAGGLFGAALGAGVVGAINIGPQVAAHEAAREAARETARAAKVEAETLNTLRRGNVSLNRYHRDSFYVKIGEGAFFREGQKEAVDILTEEFGCEWTGTANTDRVREVILLVRNGACVPGAVLPDPYQR